MIAALAAWMVSPTFAMVLLAVSAPRKSAWPEAVSDVPHNEMCVIVPVALDTMLPDVPCTEVALTAALKVIGKRGVDAS